MLQVRVRELPVLEFEQEFAIALGRVGLDDVRLERRRAAVERRPFRSPSCSPVVELYHFESLRLDHEAGVQPDLLVRRRSEMIVGEDGPQGAVLSGAQGIGALPAWNGFRQL